MKIRLLTLFLLLKGFTAFGQINMADSTTQVISYWNKEEKNNYSVSLETIKIRELDTIYRATTRYNVEITVLDTSNKSLMIQWLYKDFTTDSQIPIVRKLVDITKDMKIIFKTDEFGAFVEVVNWREVKDYIQEGITTLSKDLNGIPGIDKVLKQLEATYSTKEAIENGSISDVYQFHFFHGLKYRLGEVLEGNLKVSNIYGPEPFDSDVQIYLDEINVEDNNFIMRASQNVNSEQLINATMNYLKTTTQMMAVDQVKIEDMKDLKHESFTASRIHNTGWVIYSIQTKTIKLDNVTNIEERIIELK